MEATPIVHKRCTKCGEQKPAHLEFFRKQERGLHGLRSHCRVCETAYNKQQKKAFYHANAESERAKKAKSRAENPEKQKAIAKACYDRNRERFLQAKREKYSENRDAIRERRKDAYAANAESERRAQREYRVQNKERVLERDRAYRIRNLEKIRAQERVSGLAKFHKRYRVDIAYTLKVRTSALVRASLKAVGKSRKTQELLGFSATELRAHLESKFTEGMTWEKFMDGKIHIDHVRPVSSFNITSDTCSEFKACWALSNLQPLWGVDNLRKGAKVEEEA